MKIFQPFVGISLFFVVEGGIISSLSLQASDFKDVSKLTYNKGGRAPESNISSPMNVNAMRKRTVDIGRDRIENRVVLEQRRKTIAPHINVMYQQRNAKWKIPPATVSGCNQKTFDFSKQDISQNYFKTRKRSRSFSSISKNDDNLLNRAIQKSVTQDDSRYGISVGISEVSSDEEDFPSNDLKVKQNNCGRNKISFSDDDPIYSVVARSKKYGAGHRRSRSDSDTAKNSNPLKLQRFQKDETQNGRSYRRRSSTYLIAEGGNDRNSALYAGEDSGEYHNMNHRKRNNTCENDMLYWGEENYIDSRDTNRDEPGCYTPYNISEDNADPMNLYNINRDDIDSMETNNTSNTLVPYVSHNNNVTFLGANHANTPQRRHTYNNTNEDNALIGSNDPHQQYDVMIEEKLLTQRKCIKTSAPIGNTLSQKIQNNYDEQEDYRQAEELSEKTLSAEEYKQSLQSRGPLTMPLQRSANPSYNSNYATTGLSEMSSLQNVATWFNRSASVWECREIELGTGDLACFSGRGCISWGVRLGLRGARNNPLGVSHVGMVLVAYPKSMRDLIKYCARKGTLHSNDDRKKIEEYMLDSIDKEFEDTSDPSWYIHKPSLFLIHSTGKYGVHIVPLELYIKEYKGNVFVRHLKKPLEWNKLYEQIILDVGKVYNANFSQMNKAVHDRNRDKLDVSMFCSQLVADLYRHAGMIETNVMPVNITPAELTSKSVKDYLKDYALEERVLKKDDAKSCCNIM